MTNCASGISISKRHLAWVRMACSSRFVLTCIFFSIVLLAAHQPDNQVVSCCFYGSLKAPPPVMGGKCLCDRYEVATALSTTKRSNCHHQDINITIHEKGFIKEAIRWWSNWSNCIESETYLNLLKPRERVQIPCVVQTATLKHAGHGNWRWRWWGSQGQGSCLSLFNIMFFYFHFIFIYFYPALHCFCLFWTFLDACCPVC